MTAVAFALQVEIEVVVVPVLARGSCFELYVQTVSLAKEATTMASYKHQS